MNINKYQHGSKDKLVIVRITKEELEIKYSFSGKSYLDEVSEKHVEIDTATEILLNNLKKRGKYQHVFRNGLNSTSLNEATNLALRSFHLYLHEVRSLEQIIAMQEGQLKRDRDFNRRSHLYMNRNLELEHSLISNKSDLSMLKLGFKR